MKVLNVHERLLSAPPGQVEALFGDMDALWPTHLFPAPERENGGLRIGPMLWEPAEHAGAALAFRVAEPPEFPAEHWFDVRADGGGAAILRHTVEGEAFDWFEELWRDRIEPFHNAYIEALFDRAGEALA